MIRLSCTLLLLFLTFAGLQAQNFESTLERYGTEFSQERAYLHYDKAAYSPGETIWFKVYLMEGPFPADASKNFYIDWTDETGKLIGRTSSPLYEGTTNGQFDLPAGYTGKYIHARGYTRWMLNFDSAFLYNKDIRVLQASGVAKNKPQPATYLEFFPEGGDMIQGLVNKVAFKAHDEYGIPVNVKGVVINAAGKVVDSLRVQHDGMGVVFITPNAGDVITAVWKDARGAEKKTPLPAAKATGITLQVSPIKDKRYFAVSVERGAAFDPGQIYLVGTMGQVMVFKLAKDSKAGEIKGVIPTKDLPSGILTITAFDDKWQPLAERITYINNQEYVFTPGVEVKHWGMNKRARNDIEVTIPDNLTANLSVSITDAGIETDSSDNIITRLLLTGDLKGQVYKPGYYFNNTSDTVARHLDLVMLTHGWRRFKWEDVASGKLPAISYPRDTTYLTVSGRVYGATAAELKEAQSIILMSKPKNAEGNVMVVPLQPDGQFVEPTLILFDSTTIYYQFSKGKKMNSASVRFLENKLPALTSNLSASARFANPSPDTTGFYRHMQLAKQEQDLLKLYEGQLLENVVVKSRTKTPEQLMDEKYASGLFSGGDGYSFDLLSDPLASANLNIFTYLQGKVAGLQIFNATGGGTPSMQWRGGSPQLFLNEIPTDADMISSLSVNDVAYVKIIRPPFMGSINGANGAIAIYTRKGNDVKSEPGKGLPSNVVTGYTAIRQFYSPNYSSFKQDQDKKDMRTTLYWNPQLMASPGKGKINFSFYNNDFSQAFRIVIEGMTRDGKLTRIEQILE